MSLRRRVTATNSEHCEVIMNKTATIPEGATGLRNPRVDMATGEIFEDESPANFRTPANVAASTVDGGTWSLPAPTSFTEMREIAAMWASTEMVPKHYRGKPDDIIVAWQKGAELGLKPMQSLQHIATINGTPTVWGDAVLALVRQSGLLERFQERFTFDDAGQIISATCSAKRAGSPDVIERHFSLADAQAASLLGKQGPWQQYRGRMLQMRARSWALRDGFGDVLGGLHVREEYMGTVVEGQTIDGDGNVIKSDLAEEFQESRKDARKAARLRGESVSGNGRKTKPQQVSEKVRAAKGKGKAPATAEPDQGAVADMLAAIADATTTDDLEKLGDGVDQIGNKETSDAFAARWAEVEEK